METLKEFKNLELLEKEILKSQNDTRSYRCMVLENQLQILLISDTETDKEAASMDVHVGHFSDPETIPGLAHFLEHLLFMGTEKYPKENDYSQFLSEHGGNSNAFTSQENTNYYFDVTAGYLEPALDRFAQFFIAPLFSPDGTDREMQAVDSEHKKNLQSDYWRLYQLEKELCDPAHPYHKFGTGNLETLQYEPNSKNISVREELLEFHRNYYSTELMKLVILGRGSLDELATLASETFSSIKRTELRDPERPISSPFHTIYLNRLIRVIPVKDLRLMELTFVLPEQISHFRTKPSRYFSHLLGHEAEGSILYLLKRLGWASELTAGPSRSATDFELFKLSIELSELGIQHVMDIIKIIFQYIQLIRTQGIQKWIFEECKSLHEIDFRFKEKERPDSYVSRLASTLYDYPAEFVLCVHDLLFDYDEELLSKTLNHLNPRNFNVTVIDKDFENIKDIAWNTESRYKSNYAVERLSEDYLCSLTNPGLHPELHLPHPNSFIPSDFQLKKQKVVSEAQKFPQLLIDSPSMRAWFKQDDKFKVPKRNLYISLYSPLIYASPSYAVQSRIFVDLLKDKLSDITYAAELAGMHYSIEVHSSGILLDLRGYDEKQLLLLSEILETMTNFSIDPIRFDVIKDDIQREYSSFSKESPHQQSSFALAQVTQDVVWSFKERLRAIEDVSMNTLSVFANTFKHSVYFEALIHGNCTPSNAAQIVDCLHKKFSSTTLYRNNVIRRRAVQLSKDVFFEFSLEDPLNLDCSLILLFQIGAYENVYLRCLSQLFVEMIHEAFFNQLRTIEQLGYIVHAHVRNQNGALAIAFVLQSERHPRYLEERVNQFLHEFRNVLSGMEKDTFNRFLESLVARKLEKDKNLRQETKRYWEIILNGSYDFDRNLIEVKELQGFSKEDVIQFFDDYLASKGSRRAKLSVHALSSKVQDSKSDLNVETSFGLRIEDISDFKNTSSLFPLPKPINLSSPLMDLNSLDLSLL